MIVVRKKRLQFKDKVCKTTQTERIKQKKLKEWGASDFSLVSLKIRSFHLISLKFSSHGAKAIV